MRKFAFFRSQPVAGFRLLLFHLFQMNHLQALVPINLLLINDSGNLTEKTAKILFRGRTGHLVGFAELITGGYTSSRGWHEVAWHSTFLFTRHC